MYSRDHSAAEVTRTARWSGSGWPRKESTRMTSSTSLWWRTPGGRHRQTSHSGTCACACVWVCVWDIMVVCVCDGEHLVDGAGRPHTVVGVCLNYPRCNVPEVFFFCAKAKERNVQFSSNKFVFCFIFVDFLRWILYLTTMLLSRCETEKLMILSITTYLFLSIGHVSLIVLVAPALVITGYDRKL